MAEPLEARGEAASMIIICCKGSATFRLFSSLLKHFRDEFENNNGYTIYVDIMTGEKLLPI